MFFSLYGLQLQLKEGWKVVHKDEQVTVVEDMNECVGDVCSGFRVYNQNSTQTDSPYFYGCGNDDPGTQTKVGGKPAAYQKLAMYCGSPDEPSDKYEAFTETWFAGDLAIHTVNVKGRPHFKLDDTLVAGSWK